MHIVSKLFNSRAAGIYLLLFAAAIAIATFIENDFGTSAAQKLIYKAWWFELLLVLFGFTILVNIFKYKFIQKRNWALLLSHSAIIIILIGSAVTRYFGYEGIMHIREGDASSSFYSSETYLQFEVIKGNEKYQFDEPVLFASLGKNRFKESYLLDNDLIEVKVKEFIPNPVQTLEESDLGKPILKIVFGGSTGREEYFISQGSERSIGNILFNFTNTFDPEAVNIFWTNDSLFIKSNRILTQMTMSTRELDTLYPSEKPHNLELKSLYKDGISSFVFGEFLPSGKVTIQSENAKVKNESLIGLLLEITINGEPQETYVFGQKGIPGKRAIVHSDQLSMAVSYGSKSIQLPFKIGLYDFIMERYPGTNNAVSYASEVKLIDSRNNLEKDYRIYMNHILNYNGYRFFQSSYDRDEKGTYLSVNHDFWGTWISYFGYALFTLGLIMTLFSKKSRFFQLSQMIKKIRTESKPLILIVLFSGLTFQATAQKVITQSKNVISSDHAKLFSKMVVQDMNGRMKPIHTLSRELLRKIAKKETIDELTPDQVILSMYADNKNWYSIPIIKIGKNEKIQKGLKTANSLVAYKDFFLPDGTYKFEDEVRQAFAMQPVDRGTYEKELLKIDERVNIANMIFSGRILKMFPLPNDPNNTWLSAHQHGSDSESALAADQFFSDYKDALHHALHSNDYSLPGKMLSELAAYQRENGAAVIPSKSKINTEILLNNLDVFNRLSGLYSLLGIGLLVLLFISVFKPSANLTLMSKIFLGLVLLGFAFHTVGLGLRWYIAERAPWSNGYESMIYIAWTTTLAGLIFTRKSFGGLAATMVLAGTILMVARLSYLDPEITPLVPVLRSYWLTIHVSLEAGSYGFLMLGALIGLINLVLMILLSNKNKERIFRIIKEMTYLSEMTLIAGLIMISVGTYLGGIWANESWGRYWGWDAKETWALVTILIYAFILHMRLIPKMGGLFAYNVATIFGWASVLMTYFGVNYYLSGLHSYAAGDPAPIPSWVYISVITILAISLLAYIRKRKVIQVNGGE